MIAAARRALSLAEIVVELERELAKSRDDVHAHVDQDDAIARLVGLSLDDDDADLAGVVQGLVNERDVLRSGIVQVLQELNPRSPAHRRLEELLVNATAARRAPLPPVVAAEDGGVS